MPDLSSNMPRYLAERTRTLLLSDSAVPTLLAHPDWTNPAPLMFWMHGRTASKELDPGRYLRWIRAGIAAVAIDMPGHGERRSHSGHSPSESMAVLRAVLPQIDDVLHAIRQDPALSPFFDTARAGIGGMSLGGIAALRRLAQPHNFSCASVEGTIGSFDDMPDYSRLHSSETLAELNPISHVDSWRPIPLQIIHSEADRVAPVEGMRRFAEAVRNRYASLGRSADSPDSELEWISFPSTGAPEEHIGFGRFSSEAKAAQTAFLVRHLLDASPPANAEH